MGFAEDYNRKVSRVAEYESIEGGRKPLTVGELRERLAGLPDAMPVRVSHEPARQLVGVQDILVARRQEFATVVDLCDNMPVAVRGRSPF